jgi:hypothetical protein
MHVRYLSVYNFVTSMRLAVRSAAELGSSWNPDFPEFQFRLEPNNSMAGTGTLSFSERWNIKFIY